MVERGRRYIEANEESRRQIPVNWFWLGETGSNANGNTLPAVAEASGRIMVIRVRKEGRRRNLFQRRPNVSTAHAGHKVEEDQGEQQNADDSVQDLILQRFFVISVARGHRPPKRLQWETVNW